MLVRSSGTEETLSCEMRNELPMRGLCVCISEGRPDVAMRGPRNSRCTTLITLLLVSETGHSVRVQTVSWTGLLYLEY